MVVRADDPAETVNDTFGYTYGILETLDRENTDAALSHIEDGMGQVKTAGFGTLTQLADALLNRQAGRRYPQQQLLLRPQGYGGIPELLQGPPRSFIRFSIDKEDPEPIAPNANISREPFVVYCSGTDERVDYIPLNSRSDTNILAVVNPSTHQILLVSTPGTITCPFPLTGRRISSPTSASTASRSPSRAWSSCITWT